MDDGLRVPDHADGMGAFHIDADRVALVRNNELEPKHAASGAFATPARPSGAVARVAAADLEMGGKTIREGQRVFAFVNSANRDPEAFEDPERFDIGRPVNPHMTRHHQGRRLAAGPQNAGRPQPLVDPL